MSQLPLTAFSIHTPSLSFIEEKTRSLAVLSVNPVPSPTIVSSSFLEQQQLSRSSRPLLTSLDLKKTSFPQTSSVPQLQIDSAFSPSLIQPPPSPPSVPDVFDFNFSIRSTNPPVNVLDSLKKSLIDLGPHLSGFLVDFASNDQKWTLKGTVFRANAAAPFKVHLFTSPPIENPYAIDQQHLLVEFQRRSGDPSTFCQFFKGICLTLQSKFHQYYFPESLFVHPPPLSPVHVKSPGLAPPRGPSAAGSTSSHSLSLPASLSRSAQEVAAASSTVSSLLAMIQSPFSDIVLEGLRGLIRCSEIPLNALQMVATAHFLDAVNHHLLETSPSHSRSSPSGFTLHSHEETRHYAVSLLHNILKAIPASEKAYQPTVRCIHKNLCLLLRCITAAASASSAFTPVSSPSSASSSPPITPPSVAPVVNSNLFLIALRALSHAPHRPVLATVLIADDWDWIHAASQSVREPVLNACARTLLKSVAAPSVSPPTSSLGTPSSTASSPAAFVCPSVPQHPPSKHTQGSPPSETQAQQSQLSRSPSSASALNVCSLPSSTSSCSSAADISSSSASSSRRASYASLSTTACPGIDYSPSNTVP